MAKLSDAEYEIMKIIWEDQEKTTLFSYIMDELIKQGRPCQYADRAFIPACREGLFEGDENRTAE